MRKGIALWTLLVGAALAQNGLAQPSESNQPLPTVVEGKARFQILSPTLIRLEYDENASFEDRTTFFAVNRDFPEVEYATGVADGWREIRTEKLLLRYRRGSGRFGPDNLSIRPRDTADSFTARPVWERPCEPGAACQAEDADRRGTVRVRRSHADYAGTGYAGPFDGNAARLVWTVENVPQAGPYAVAVRYASETAATTLRLRVNEGDAHSLELAATERWDERWNAWGEVADTVRLRAGTNRIALSCPEDSCAAYLDYLAVTEPGADLASREPAPTPGNLGGWRHDLGNVRGEVPLHDGLLSRRGWYLLNDSSTPTWNGDGWLEARERSDTYQDGYFFGYGKDYKTALHDFARLTGPPPLLPRWAFGVWFSRFYPYSASDYRQTVVPRFRDERVPLDALIIDTDFKTPNRWNGWNWKEKLFPRPEAFLDWTEREGIQVALNVHPSIMESDPQFPKADSIGGGLISETDCPRWQNVTEPCSVWNWSNRRHAASYLSLHEPFERQGVDFWWLDWCCDASRATMRGLTPDGWVNHLYATHRREQSRRRFVLSRIGASWQNRSAVKPGPWAAHRSAIHFTGDTYPTWEMLAFQSKFTIREGNIGVPYVSHDIGSFHAGGPRADSLPGDLYARWVQFGAFQPIFRLHGHHGERLPWNYQGAVRETAARFMRLREALVPYTYTLARQAHDTGLPMVRGLYLNYPETENAYRFDRQYLLGNQLLVAPAAKPGQEIKKEIWFPPGRWTDFFTGKVYEGRSVETLTVPLERMPVCAKAGGIVPMQPYMKHVGQKPVDPLRVRVYPGADGRFRLYEDAGSGLDYENGQHAWTELRYDESQQTFTIGATEGSYSSQPAARDYRVTFVNAARPDAVLVDGRPLSEKEDENSEPGWRYEESSLMVYVSDVPRTSGAKITLAP
jgi:alpha-glucosidase (family GH31 glycosyl hydrolase)